MSESLPTQIRAIEVPRYGGVEVLELNTVPLPIHDPTQLFIRVEYVGINFIDTYQRSGLYKAKSLPIRIGMEASGVIVKLPTDEKTLKDPQYIERGFTVGARVAAMTQGTLQDYISAPWTSAGVLPPNVTTQIGAAAALQGLTAIPFIHEAYEVKAGDWILIHAAAGGLGLLFVQLCKAKGAHVIGTTSTEEKAALAKANGAEHVIIYGKGESVPDRVLELTGGQGVHAIFDGVGKDTWEDNFVSIRRKGTIVAVGNASGVPPDFSPLKLGAKNVKLVRPTAWNYLATPEESAHYSKLLWKQVGDGQLQVKIHKSYPFSKEGVAQAHTDIASRGTSGKLIIDFSL